MVEKKFTLTEDQLAAQRKGEPVILSSVQVADQVERRAMKMTTPRKYRRRMVRAARRMAARSESDNIVVRARERRVERRRENIVKWEREDRERRLAGERDIHG